MTIIEAWKKAKEGDLIDRGNGAMVKHKVSIKEFLYGCTEEMLLSDNWEIKRKPIVQEGVVTWKWTSNYLVYPVPISGEIQFRFESFLNKKTKIRIEEITEEEG